MAGLRVTTEFWVASIVRRAFSLGGFAAVTRRGAAEAGAVLIALRGRHGDITLYAPAPQTSYDRERPDERLFAEVLRTGEEEEVARRVERELRFDPDLWVLELEAGEEEFLSLVGVTKP